MPLVDNTEGYLDIVKEFAAKVGKADQLQDKLDYLANYASARRSEGLETRCQLYKDFAPQSFAFAIQKRVDGGDWDYWFQGGLIFHGNHDNGGDGSAPTFSVNVNPQDGWSVHT